MATLALVTGCAFVTDTTPTSAAIKGFDGGFAVTTSPATAFSQQASTTWTTTWRQHTCSCTPPHPGAFVRRQCLEPLGLTVTEAAKGLAVSRNTLSMLLNGRLGISPEMAIRLSGAFGGSPESWLTQQMQYDLWPAQHSRDPVEVHRFATA